jgi:hypothetical protein
MVNFAFYYWCIQKLIEKLVSASIETKVANYIFIYKPSYPVQLPGIWLLNVEMLTMPFRHFIAEKIKVEYHLSIISPIL